MAVNRPRRNGSFAPLSAHYSYDDAIIAAGERAEVLYCRGLAFASNTLCDGRITDLQLPIVGHHLPGVTARAKRLVDVGLWLRVDGGYLIRSWLKWNRSADEIADLMAADTERKTGPNPTGPRNRSKRNPNGSREESEPIPKPSRAPDTEQDTTRQNTTGSDRTPTGPVRSDPPPAPAALRDGATATGENGHRPADPETAHRIADQIRQHLGTRPNPTRDQPTPMDRLREATPNIPIPTDPDDIRSTP